MTAERPPPFGRRGPILPPPSAGPAGVGGSIIPSPIFLVLVAAFVASGYLLWTLGEKWTVFVFVLTGWVVSLCLHEFAHAVTAYIGGDRSVAAKGYLTLDPRRYAEPGLSLVLPILFVLMGGIGLPGGAVWINRSALRNKAVDSVVSLAGPATNIVFAVLCLTPIGLGWFGGAEPAELLSSLTLLGTLDGADAFRVGLAFLGFLQVTAALLNLLPVPGLDGFGAIEPHLSTRFLAKIRPVRRWGIFAVIGLLLLPGPNRAFFDAIFGIIDTFGVDRFFVQLGDVFFRFWET